MTTTTKRPDPIGLLKDHLGGKHAGGSDWQWTKLHADGLRRVSAQVSTAAHRWDRPCTTPGMDRVLDANAMFVGAASNVRLARRTPEPRGRIAFDKHLGGYWYIRFHQWSDSRIGSPLGTAQPDHMGHVWLTTDTVQLLAQMHVQELWPAIEVADAWVSEAGEHDLRAWSAEVERLISEPGADRSAYKAMAYGLQSFWFRDEKLKSPFFRPDWFQAIRARAAAKLWYDAWRAVNAGCDVVGLGNTDTIRIHCPEPDYRPPFFCTPDAKTRQTRISFERLHCYKPAPVRDDKGRALETTWWGCRRG